MYLLYYTGKPNGPTISRTTKKRSPSNHTTATFSYVTAYNTSKLFIFQQLHRLNSAAASAGDGLSTRSWNKAADEDSLNAQVNL